MNQMPTLFSQVLLSWLMADRRIRWLYENCENRLGAHFYLHPHPLSYSIINTVLCHGNCHFNVSPPLLVLAGSGGCGLQPPTAEVPPCLSVGGRDSLLVSAHLQRPHPASLQLDPSSICYLSRFVFQFLPLQQTGDSGSVLRFARGWRSHVHLSQVCCDQCGGV